MSFVGVTVLGLDTDIVNIFGRVCGILRATGTLIGDLDLLIGTTAPHYQPYAPHQQS